MEINRKIYEGNNLELEDTVEMMLSEDYQERIKAEFYQTKLRFLSLEELINKYKHGKLITNPSCPIILYEDLAIHMYRHLRILARIADIEGIEL